MQTGRSNIVPDNSLHVSEKSHLSQVLPPCLPSEWHVNHDHLVLMAWIHMSRWVWLVYCGVVARSRLPTLCGDESTTLWGKNNNEYKD